MKPENESPSVNMKIRIFSPKGLLLGLLIPICRKGGNKKGGQKQQPWPLDLKRHIG